MEKLVVFSKLSTDDVLFLCQKTFREILKNENKLSKSYICETIRNLESILTQYS